MKKALIIIVIVLVICLFAFAYQWVVVHFGLETLSTVAISIGLFLCLVAQLYFMLKNKENRDGPK